MNLDFQKDTKIKLGYSNWEANSSISKPGVMNFSLNSQQILKIKPVDFGNLNEGMGIPKRYTTHIYEGYESASRLEMKTILPFGSEPEINRQIRFVANSAKIVTDLKLKRDLPIKKISVDDLELESIWDEYAIVDCNDFNLSNLKWNKIEDKVFYDKPQTFLILLLRSQEGNILEIGAGDDLWRWNIASQSDLKSQFLIKKENDKIIVSRNIYIFEENINNYPYELKLKWYFSWYENSENNIKFEDLKTQIENNINKIKENDDNCIFLELPKNWDDETLSYLNETTNKVPCLNSPIVEKYLKKKIRKINAKLANGTVYICDIEPSLCDKSIHVKRPKKDNLLHWGVIPLLDLYFWMNKQLQKNNNKLFIIPKNKDLLILPSVLQMVTTST